jgi:hypothetical protein
MLDTTRLRVFSALLVMIGLALGALGLVGWPASAESGFLDERPDAGHANDELIRQHTRQLLDDGRQTFRFDTFGSETFFGDALQLHRAIEGARFGGVGAGLGPRAALALGLKVDMDQVPNDVLRDVAAGRVNLDDPAVTLALLRRNAVVGVTGSFANDGSLKSVGIQCALCHSTVDDASGVPGIGRRLDGWPNQDLNVGAIIALAPNLSPYTSQLGVDDATVRTVLRSWGPGRFDAELGLDGKAFRPDGGNASVLIPPAFGLAGVNNHTWTGAWGTVTYWNALVANLEMHGQPGAFFDPRLDDAGRFPIAARAKLGHVQTSPDLDRISPKLPGLQFYQLALPAPTPPTGSFDAAAAQRGRRLFDDQARCATCHVPPTFTEPGWNLHTPQEIGIDDFQANRSPDGKYRTAPLAGRLFWRRRGFYHDGRFATLGDVVNHYDGFLHLGLSDAQKRDLVEYLKSL